MKIALVSPATIAEFGPDGLAASHVRDLAEHVPVGVLTLVAILKSRGHQTAFVDMNDVYARHVRERSRCPFAAYAAGVIQDTGADIVGLGTLSSSYPLTLRVARALKSERPSTCVLLGGPQATATDRATMLAFPAIDFVLRGEADESLPGLLDALRDSRDLAPTLGLSYRAGGEILRAPNAPVPVDLDAIPLPEYHLFPFLQDAGTIPLEVGRGCPYGCTFCSTNEFFRRRFRLKSPHVVVDQMRVLAERHGAASFDFVHDMLTVDRRRVVALCDALIAAGSPFTWSCSARTDRVDDELLDLMSRAGCRGVFFGIETGSPSLQRSVLKRLDLEDAPRKIDAAARRGMTVVASLITGFPDERDPDLRQTVDFFVRCLRSPEVSPQLHILAPLAGSPVHAAFQGQLRFDDVVSDMSHCGFAQDADDRREILAHPEVFASFFAVPTALDRPLLKELRLLLTEGAAALRLLLVALHEEAHLLDVLPRFRASLGPDGPAPEDLADYYRGPRFPLDLVRFIERDIQPAARAPHVIQSLVRLWRATRAARDSLREAAPTKSGVQRAPGVDLAHIEADHRELTLAISGSALLTTVARRPETLLVKAENGAVEVLALPRLAAVAMELCDGSRSEREVVRALARDEALQSAAPNAERAGKLVLDQLVENGWITRRKRAATRAQKSRASG